MADPLLSDVAVTWLGAAGCLFYARFLWLSRHEGALARAGLALFALLASLLLVRGFYWLAPASAALARLVFAVATLLPLVVTIYAEHLLRRHHPLPLKLAALGVTLTFFTINLVQPLAGSLVLLVAFLLALLAILGANGWLLVRTAGAGLSLHEAQLARGAAIAALCAVPLVTTDFREEIGHVPLRMGALGPLVLVHVLLHLAPERHAAARELLRLALVVVAAATLALVFALVTVGTGAALPQAWIGAGPVATAWVLLATILVRTRQLQAETHGQNFLRWLLHARMDHVDGLLASLRRLPLTQEHVTLRAADLAGYDLARLLGAVDGRREPLGRPEALAWARGGHADRQDAGEQWADLMDRHGMTHALIVSQAPPLVILLNLPQGAGLQAAELRAGIIQRIARRIARETAGEH